MFLSQNDYESEFCNKNWNPDFEVKVQNLIWNEISKDKRINSEIKFRISLNVFTIQNSEIIVSIDLP